MDNIANELFGEMRDATKEESESVNKYIESISENTGLTYEEAEKIEDIFRKVCNNDPERMERVRRGAEIEKEVYPDWKMERNTKAVKEFTESPAFQELIDRLV